MSSQGSPYLQKMIIFPIYDILLVIYSDICKVYGRIHRLSYNLLRIVEYTLSLLSFVD